MKYTGKLKGGPPMGAKFRFIHVKADTDVVAVMLPPGKDPVPYLSREGEKQSPPTPETHLIVPIPVAIFKREGDFREHKGGRRATFVFFEMQDKSYTEVPDAG